MAGARRGGLGADQLGAGLVGRMSAALPSGSAGLRRRGAAIELDQISFGWHGHPALRSVSGSFAAGGMTAVVGRAGKSTLIKGIAAPMAGLRIAGAGRADLAWLPQAAELDRSFP